MSCGIINMERCARESGWCEVSANSELVCCVLGERCTYAPATHHPAPCFEDHGILDRVQQLMTGYREVDYRKRRLWETVDRAIREGGATQASIAALLSVSEQQVRDGVRKWAPDSRGQRKGLPSQPHRPLS